MTSMGLGERVENRQDARPGPAKTFGERIVGGDRRLELIEEVSQHLERRTCRPLVGERQPARERRVRPPRARRGRRHPCPIAGRAAAPALPRAQPAASSSSRSASPA